MKVIANPYERVPEKGCAQAQSGNPEHTLFRGNPIRGYFVV